MSIDLDVACHTVIRSGIVSVEGIEAVEINEEEIGLINVDVICIFSGREW